MHKRVRPDTVPGRYYQQLLKAPFVCLSLSNRVQLRSCALPPSSSFCTALHFAALAYTAGAHGQRHCAAVERLPLIRKPPSHPALTVILGSSSRRACHCHIVAPRHSLLFHVLLLLVQLRASQHHVLCINPKVCVVYGALNHGWCR